MKSKILCFFFVIVLIFIFTINSFAISSNTYEGVTASTTTVQNLINQALSYDNFFHSDYVVYRADNYLYYVVWGDDFVYSNGRITASNVEFISYDRYGSGTSYYNEYRYGTDSSLTVTIDETIVSNIQIDGFSFLSTVVDEFNYRRYLHYFLIFGIGMLFVIMLSNLKGRRV